MEYQSGYKKLNVYIKANELVIKIYQVTHIFPKEELFGITSQIRRCAVSVPANIVEGYGRRTNKDKSQFCYISRGSLNELEYFIDLAHQLKYINPIDYGVLRNLREDVGKLLSGYIKSLQ